MTKLEIIEFIKVARELLKIQGRDFDTEFKKWQAKKAKSSSKLKVYIPK